MLLVACLFVCAQSAHSAENDSLQPVLIGITPAFVLENPKSLDLWRAYLEPRLGHRVEFVVRERYEELIDAVAHQRVDFAWVADYPYVLLRKRAHLIVVPVVQGKTTHRALFIVAATDTHTSTITDLRGKVFAYPDPYSFTGHILPRRDLKQAGEDADAFFRKSFYSWGHSHTVMAVASGLADGGYVDEFVWNGMRKTTPDLVAQTRVVLHSEEFPGAPIIARSTMGASGRQLMAAVLTQMGSNAEGRAVLQQMQLDGFAPGRDRDYDAVARVVRALGQQ